MNLVNVHQAINQLSCLLATRMMYHGNGGDGTAGQKYVGENMLRSTMNGEINPFTAFTVGNKGLQEWIMR